MSKGRLIGISVAGLVALVVSAGAAILGWSQVLRLREGLSTATSERDALEAERASLRADLANKDAELLAALDARDQLEEDYDRVRQALSQAASDLEAIESFIGCGSDWSIEYAGNAAVSEDLRGWVSAVAGTADRADWLLIWDDASAAIHRITVRNPAGGFWLFAFIVFYERDPQPYGDGVFFLNDACWLDY